MQIRLLEPEFSVCKVKDWAEIPLDAEFLFVGQTDQELSVVCPSGQLPQNTVEVEEGWRGFRLEGQLDFGLVGILAQLSAVLAQGEIPIFALSTFNTDYILVKKEQLDKAVGLLKENGYQLL